MKNAAPIAARQAQENSRNIFTVNDKLENRRLFSGMLLFIYPPVRTYGTLLY